MHKQKTTKVWVCDQLGIARPTFDAWCRKHSFDMNQAPEQVMSDIAKALHSELEKIDPTGQIRAGRSRANDTTLDSPKARLELAKLQKIEQELKVRDGELVEIEDVNKEFIGLNHSLKALLRGVGHKASARILPTMSVIERAELIQGTVDEYSQILEGNKYNPELPSEFEGINGQDVVYEFLRARWKSIGMSDDQIMSYEEWVKDKLDREGVHITKSAWQSNEIKSNDELLKHVHDKLGTISAKCLKEQINYYMEKIATK